MKIVWNISAPLTEEENNYIERAIESVLKIEDLSMEGEVSVSVFDSEMIRSLNRDYRGIDRTTDVLSFPQYTSLEEIRTERYLFLGDIVLNVEKMKEQALEYGHSTEREIAYLTIHSMYHLLGFDHENENDKQAMRKKEEEAYRHLEEQ
ncbi:rRNA maturation RNase YbeY [Guggenheimella bovis]